jgi:hypothetical protein
LFASTDYIFNLSLRTKIVPSSWKIAKVTPLFKKGSLSDPNNYRPISILPSLAKIFERHIHTHFMAYLNNNNLLCKEQSGFRSFHSCQTALTSLVDEWASAIDNNKLVGILLIDFRKAFDLVNHNILIEKLKLYKCSDATVSIFKSYLSDRLQCTMFNGHMSNSANLTVGVPQGSILGPLLFLLYINDLHLISNDSCHMFADDSTFYTSASTVDAIESNLVSDLSEISNWCKTNQMSLHLGKTKTMLLTTRQKRAHLEQTKLNITFLDKDIECVSTHKLLGVTLDENLTWKDHCNDTCSKIRKKLFLLRKLKPILPFSARLQFFNSFILPHFDYCSNIWFSSHRDCINSLTILQKRAMRLILDVPFNTPSIDMLKSLNWMSFEFRCFYNTSILVFKCLNNLSPSYLNLFKINDNNRTRSSTRSDLLIPFAKKDILKNSFRCNGAKIFNSIPSTIRNSPSLASFKRASFKHFISKCYETVL